MPTWTPDPSFYPSPRQAAKAPPETLAYVAAFDPDRKTADRIAIVDVDPKSASYAKIIGDVVASEVGDEFHHFGWNACSSCLCPNAPHPHVERRYLIVPGLRSSRIYVLDTKPNPRAPKIVKVIEPAELADKTGYTRPHTVHCGPGGIYVAALGNKDGKAPGGVFIMDQESFEPLGRWEVDRGPQQLAYDAWWHLGYDTMVTSEWGTPDTFENGLVPEILLGSKYGRRLHFWDFTKRKHLQEIDFGEEHQLVFELRPAHDPTKAHGFVNCVVSLKDLSSSIWTWYRDGNKWAVKKIISIPAEPADPDDLPPVLKGFKAVPPLVTDIDLSMDDRFLYVACWGTGDLQQYDVSDPFNPRLTGKVRIGGIVSRASHPAAKNGKLNGGPQMVEVSRDGRRVYFTNSLYGAIDPQFYPEGIDGWMVKLDAGPAGGVAFDPAMGWLFAVALGLHRGSQRIVLLSLVPIAVGHAAAVAAVLLAVLALGLVIDHTMLIRLAAIVLIAWAAWHALYGHQQRVRVGMQTGLLGLVLWSFLMASAHGAGLMLIPALQPICAAAGAAAEASSGTPLALAALGVHSAAMLATIAAVSLIVYHWTGVDFLRRGWINLDLIWVAVLATCGAVLLFA